MSKMLIARGRRIYGRLPRGKADGRRAVQTMSPNDIRQRTTPRKHPNRGETLEDGPFIPPGRSRRRKERMKECFKGAVKRLGGPKPERMCVLLGGNC